MTRNKISIKENECLLFIWNRGALWGKKYYTQPQTGEVHQGGIHDYVVYHVPRSTFRRAASRFADVRQTESDARYEEMSLQLFMQMVYMTGNLEEGQGLPKDIFPYMKVWIEWVPSAKRSRKGGRI